MQIVSSLSSTQIYRSYHTVSARQIPSDQDHIPGIWRLQSIFARAVKRVYSGRHVQILSEHVTGERLVIGSYLDARLRVLDNTGNFELVGPLL